MDGTIRVIQNRLNSALQRERQLAIQVEELRERQILRITHIFDAMDLNTRDHLENTPETMRWPIIGLVTAFGVPLSYDVEEVTVEKVGEIIKNDAIELKEFSDNWARDTWVARINWKLLALYYLALVEEIIRINSNNDSYQCDGCQQLFLGRPHTGGVNNVIGPWGCCSTRCSEIYANRLEDYQNRYANTQNL